MGTIAGHTFVETPQGRKCACGKRWVDVAGATKADLACIGVAHTGSLNNAELEQIHAEVERLWEIGKGV